MISYQGLKKLGYTDNDFVLQNDGNGVYIKEWNHTDTQPTEAQIETAHNEWKTEYDAKQYQRDRQYPSIQEQLDMQYWDAVNGTTTWKDAIAQVKADNPKPE